MTLETGPFGHRSEELQAATNAVGDPLVEVIEPAVLYFHRKAFQRAVRDDFLRHVTEARTPPGETIGEMTATILFVDLSGFTPLTESMGDDAAARVVERFSDLVREAVRRHAGKVVKQIGDEFMLVFADPSSGVQCGLDIGDAISVEPQLGFPECAALNSGKPSWPKLPVRLPRLQAHRRNLPPRLHSPVATLAGEDDVAYTSVVVGSDGSPTAELAVQQAAEIAARHGARLVIVTAYKPHGDELAQQHGVPDDMRWALTDVRQAEQKVSRGRELAAAAGAKGAVTQALAGSPADVILEAAHDYAADVIVVGSKGLTNAAHVVMGSVASSVLHHAPCDVLVVQTTG